MYTTSDIYSVSDFNRKPSEHIKRLHETKRPEVLTVNGKAAVVMVDPGSYDKLVANSELLETMATITQANAEFEAGLARPADQVFRDLKAELKAKYPNDL